MGIFKRSFSLRLWIDMKMLCSLMSSFGTLEFPRKWVFLLGKPLGAKF